MDFIVREIDSSGRVAGLVGEAGTSAEEVEGAAFPPVQRAEVSEATLSAFQSWLQETLGEDNMLLRESVESTTNPTEDGWDLLHSFLRMAASEDSSCSPQFLGNNDRHHLSSYLITSRNYTSLGIYLVCKCAVKEKRTAVHNYFKQNFQVSALDAKY